MKRMVTVISIIVGALRTVLKNLEERLGQREISERIETIEMTTQLGTARILRYVLESKGDLLSLSLSEKLPVRSCKK